MIKQEDGRYCLYSKDGKKKLGCHDTREEAEQQEAAIESEKKSMFDPANDDAGASRVFLKKLREILQHLVTAEQFKSAVKQARGYAGGVMKKRKRKMAEDHTGVSQPDVISAILDDIEIHVDEGHVAACDMPMVPPAVRLSKSRPVVAFSEGGGTSDRHCGACRFWQVGACQLVEGTIEAQDTCALFQEQPSFAPPSFSNAELADIAAFRDQDDKESANGYVLLTALPATFAEDAWIPYLPVPGTYSHPKWGSIVITEGRNRRFMDNFRSGVYQKELPIDAEHQTKLSGAFGYVEDMRQNDDGSVDAKVRWTDRGREAMEQGAFKYFSPEWFDRWRDPMTDQVFEDVAIGGALTSRPFFKEKALRPLVASERGCIDFRGGESPIRFTKEENMPEDTKAKKGLLGRLREALGYGDDVEDSAIQAELLSVMKPEDANEPASANEPEPEPKSAAERIQALEADVRRANEDAKAAREETASLRAEARHKRFTEVVHGRVDGKQLPRWFGKTSTKVAFLEKLANQFGEDSPEVQEYIASEQAAANALESGGLLRELGDDGEPVETGESTAAIEQEVASIAKKFTEENPDLTRAQASTRAWDSRPDLKAKYRELGRRGR